MCILIENFVSYTTDPQLDLARCRIGALPDSKHVTNKNKMQVANSTTKTRSQTHDKETKIDLFWKKMQKDDMGFY